MQTAGAGAASVGAHEPAPPLVPAVAVQGCGRAAELLLHLRPLLALVPQRALQVGVLSTGSHGAPPRTTDKNHDGKEGAGSRLRSLKFSLGHGEPDAGVAELRGVLREHSLVVVRDPLPHEPVRALNDEDL